MVVSLPAEGSTSWYGWAGDVTTAVNTPSSDTSLAVINSDARVAGSLVGFLGDSITVGAGASNVSFGFRNVVPTIAGGLVVSPVSINGGVSGETSTQVLARVGTVIGQGAQTLFVMVGTNDVGSALSIATYQANIAAFKVAADNAGLPIAFGTIPPRGSGATTAQVDATTARNLWLTSWCAANGVPLADTWGALVDPVTGRLAAAYDSGDGVHPNNAGHVAIAVVVAGVLSQLIQAPAWPVKAAGLGLLADPLQTLTGGPNFSDDMWQTIAGSVDIYEAVAASGGDLPAGQWTRIGYASTTAFWTGAATVNPAGWGAGDKLAFFARVRGNKAGALNKIQVLNQANAVLQVAQDGPPVANPGPVAFSYTVPSTSTPTAIKFAITVAGTAGSPSYIDIGACDVFNLTRLGIDLPL